MPFPVLGSNSAVAGYEIDNSLRFNDGDSPKLTKTFGSAGTSVRTFTISFWVKKCLNGKVNDLCGVTNGLQFIFRSGDDLRINFFTPGTDFSDFITTQLFRDPSAWYHIVLAVDTTQGTEANRKKLYVNGSQVTSFATQNFPTQNRDLSWNSTAEHQIGYSAQSNNYSDIYLSDFNSVDGQALDPTYFGETNDNGVWIPKAYEGTYGTNGFKLEFQDSGNLGDDTSGNGNDFTATNLTATDQTTDTPTNNFCTLNPLAAESGFTFSEGNIVSVSSTDNTTHGSTFAVRKGKWYWEVAFATHVDTVGSGIILVEDYTSNLGYSGATSYYFDANGDKIHNSTATSLFGNISNEGHLQYALDLDNGRFSFGFEGTWSNGSSAQSTTFNASDFDFTGIPTGVDYFIARGQMSGTSSTLRFNFGNPSQSFQGNGYTDANGYGNFQTPVPSGYYALCTKNLAEYG
jgi:hypothetical protein